MKALLRATLLLLGSWIPFSSASPLESSSYDNIVYFADSDSNTVERYSLAAETFLTPLSLSQNPLAIHVDASGIYVSYGTQIIKLALDGGGEADFRTISQNITDIEATNQYLVLAGYGYLQVVNKVNGALIDSSSPWQIASSISLAKDGGAIYGASVSFSPADVALVPLDTNGDLGNVQQSPYHGDYEVKDHPQEFPTKNLLVDRSGNVYHTMDLTHAGDLGGAFSAIAFWQGLPLVLREDKVFSYNAWLQQTGVYQLGLSGANELLVYQDKVFTFARTDANAPSVEVFDVDLTTPADPAVMLDPANLEYQPDSFALDADADTLYLLSKAQLSIFRWSVSQQEYLPGIHLTNTPRSFSYASEQQRIYLAYADGTITFIDLSTDTEIPFAKLSGNASAITSAGDLLLVSQGEYGNWGLLHVYNQQDKIGEQSLWNAYSDVAWDSVNRRIYLRDPHLTWLGVSETGEYIEQSTAYYYNTLNWSDQIRVSDNGRFIALGDGAVLDYSMALLKEDLIPTGSFKDTTWLHGNLFSLQGIDNDTYSQLDHWNADFTRDIPASKQLLGEPVGLIPIATLNKLLVICRQNGRPVFDLFEFSEVDFDNDGVSDSQDLFPADAAETLDFDLDGVGDIADTDDDGDGVFDDSDIFPLNPNETTDTDGDNIGNNSDTDDDNDGVADINDRFPLDFSESGDMDNDNIGDNSDPDKDGDYISNDQDALPDDPTEWLDTDMDGTGNNSDADDDNDAVDDIVDLYPFNPDESSDMDWDGIGDNSDPDRDGDSVLNALDQFPNNVNEWLDTDTDGLGNNSDTDDDGDGVADNLDFRPLDASESKDSDVDGIGDNSDPDRDGDGVANGQDTFPNNASEWLDSDSDDRGNNADSDDDNDSVTDIRDFYPLDASKSNINANDFLPLAKSNQWIYDQYDVPVTLGADKKIANQTIRPIQFPHGYKVYLKVVNNQVQLFGFYFANVDVGFGPFSTDFMFNKGVDLLSTNSQSGKGTVNISPQYGKKDMNWSVSVTYLGSESLVLPAGQYNGMHTRVSFTGTTTIDGQPLQLSYAVDYWFAEDVGLVQLAENGWTMSLVSASINDPVDENPETPTENTSGGGGGGGSINYWLLILLILLLPKLATRKNN